MKPVKVAPNQFVNLDHVVEFTYSPASTRTENIRDEHDHDISKNTHIELGSSLTIVLSTGRQITLYRLLAAVSELLARTLLSRLTFDIRMSELRDLDLLQEIAKEGSRRVVPLAQKQTGLGASFWG